MATTYKDSNGVTWLLIEVSGGKMFGTADPATPNPRYDPLQSDTHVDTRGRVIAAIDAYAKAHRAEVVLQVTASPSGGGGALVVVALLVALALMDE